MRFLRGLLPVLGTVLLGALPLAAQAPPAPTPLQPGEDIHVEFARATALLAQLPGASFYHRLRERFGRLAT